MALFGKNDEELQKIQLNIEAKQLEIDALESENRRKELQLKHAIENIKNDRESFEKERGEFLEVSSKELNRLATERSKLEERLIELRRLEAEAKVGFVREQSESFKEVFNNQKVALDVRKTELDDLATNIAQKLKGLNDQQGEIAKRELVVTEREQKADAGFADKVQVIAEEANRQHKANQDEAERLRKLSETITAERNDIEICKADLVKREHEILIEEHRRDAGFSDERASFQKEMSAIREKKLFELEEELERLRIQRLGDITKSAEGERERIREEIFKERKQLETERLDLEKEKRSISAMQLEVEGNKEELDQVKQNFERKEQRSEQQWQKRNDEIEDSIEIRIEERIKSMKDAEAVSRAELTRLRNSLRIQSELTGAFDQLSRMLGGKDPVEIIQQINSQTNVLKILREELATRPTEEMRERYEALAQEAKTHKTRVEELVRQITSREADLLEVGELRRKSSELSAENQSLLQKASLFEGAANEAHAELSRLRSAYERPVEEEARHKEIEIPFIKLGKARKPVKAEVDENSWLADVGNACEEYGLHFNPRILKAFHTALKTAEWSPLTVLSGVSGTGKSELPRLYSHFGGIYFESLSVQPNWDSQESMLGFFNSIDNKFDAQPVLRLLAQSQKKWVDASGGNCGYPGLEDAVSLVLLDEMNLAHPELYFAEFLSKLENRRGRKGSDVPFLPVKIGSGLEPYQLPLGRNVLWAGTMNQDETTKSLSDKVLDRSIIINFPRPTHLKRRVKLAPLDGTNCGAILHKADWQNWLAQSSDFSEEVVRPYKLFIEEINASLAVSGRAIGHRIWQSIEYYMANYPDVRIAQNTSDKDALAKAMHIAFEDQLVQKIMPKLRGIDTRGKSKTDCLDKIREQIVTGIGGNSFNLTEDFDLASELGYGQFIWQSANYLKEDAEVSGEQDSAIILTEESLIENLEPDLSQPPVAFLKDKPTRMEKWDAMTEIQKRKCYETQKKK